jgi:dTMP kinase
MTRGRFISFEGGEGAGKSLQQARLAEALETAGYRVLRTREPGGSPSAEEVRALLLAHGRDWQPVSEALLHYAARAEHLAETIRPALAAGTWVLSDRFSDSTRAYQGWGQGMPLAEIDALDSMVVGAAKPDLTLLLDLPADVGLARAGKRGQGTDRYEAMAPAFHRRLRDGYLALAAADPGRFAVIDADRPAEAVAAAVAEAVRSRLGAAL